MYACMVCMHAMTRAMSPKTPPQLNWGMFRLATEQRCRPDTVAHKMRSFGI